jgi:hypothetical protein
MICDETRIRLDIRRLWLAGMKGLRIDDVLVEIVTTPCTFGGERRWFLCPRCGRRCAVLYEGYRCRLCIRGRYRSELRSPVDRMIVTARKLRRQLGQDDPNPTTPIPDKPHRMRWHTYLRIRAEIRRLETEVVMRLDTQRKRPI